MFDRWPFEGDEVLPLAYLNEPAKYLATVVR